MPSEFKMKWEDKAEQRIKRAPFFVRPFARAKAEAEARKRGLDVVTEELLEELKKANHK